MPNPNDTADDDTTVLDGPEGEADGDEQGDQAGAAEGQGDGAAASEGGTTDAAGDDAGDEVVVTIGDEKPPEEDEQTGAAPWVRDLRKANRLKDRQLREKDAEIARLKGSTGAPAALTLGEKPTLAGLDYDEAAFEVKLAEWHDRKRQIADQESARADAEKKARDGWEATLGTYRKAAAALKVKDFEEAEASVQDTLSVVQQGVILSGAEKPELLVYALGKNPGKAKELAAITDPVKFAFAVAKLEAQLKVQPRKTAPVPERVVRGGVPGALAGGDPELDRLRTEADKSGDRTKVAQYLRNKAQKAGVK